MIHLTSSLMHQRKGKETPHILQEAKKKYFPYCTQRRSCEPLCAEIQPIPQVSRLLSALAQLCHCVFSHARDVLQDSEHYWAESANRLELTINNSGLLAVSNCSFWTTGKSEEELLAHLPQLLTSVMIP